MTKKTQLTRSLSLRDPVLFGHFNAAKAGKMLRAKLSKNYGGRSSVGRVPDCDSGRRGFEPHRPPHIREQGSQ